MSEKLESFRKELHETMSPVEALAIAYKNAPHPMIRSFFDRKVLEILAVELPKLQQSVTKGPTMLVDEIPNIGNIFADTMQAMPENKRPTATVQSIGEEIGQILDKGIRRVLLDDETCLRPAISDLLSGHAQLIAALSNLALTEEQRQLIADAKESQDAVIAS